MRKLLVSSAAVLAINFFSSVAMSADIETPQAFDWTGVYLGGYVGYTDFDTKILGVKNSFNGFTGGAILGGNYQMDQFVMGLEGDIGFTGADGSFSAPIAHTQAVDMTYAMRARLGYAIDNTLIFAQGGVAFADFRAKSGGARILKDTATGWQIGAGVEHAFTENITLRIDGLYTDYGKTKNISVAPAGFDVKNFTARIGMTYLF